MLKPAVCDTKFMTMDDLEKAFPKRKRALTPELVDIFNASLSEPEFQGESLLQTTIGYENILDNMGHMSFTDYVNAVRFCAYVITFDDNFTRAYVKTFYHRDFVKERKDLDAASVGFRELSSAASRYRRSKAVVAILTHSQVPLELLFTGGRYRACMVLMDRMENSKLDKDKIAAAKELLAATKGADNIKIELGVSREETSATKNLMDQLSMIASRQQQLLESGASNLSEFGNLKVVEAVEDEDEN